MNNNLRAQGATSLFILFALALFTVPVSAGPTVVWQLNSRAEILKGEARGVSITDTGAITLAPQVSQSFDTGQAYIWSSAADARGTVYLGTGHDGRIYRVTADGKGALLYDAAELDVTALALGVDGTLYAGTSPDGKVYRIGSDGKAETYFDPPDKYIWSLAVMPNGALAIGTGDKGKLYRVTAANAKPEDSLLYDTNETHVISLAVDNQGNLLAGTDPGGLVLRISADGKAFALLDAGLREIHSLVSAPDGSIYALALSEAASSSSKSGSAVPTTSESGGVTTTVSITGVDDSSAATTPAARSRNDLANVRSAVFRILPAGGSDILWSSTTVTAFALARDPDRAGVLVGTSDKGRVYAVTADGRDTLLWQSTEGQISTFAQNGRDTYAATSNQGRLFKFGTGAVSEGTYESPVRDAKLAAAWGRIWWQGDSGLIELSTRSGNTERPDATWSDWSAAYRDAQGTQIASPRARFIQWRATLRSAARGGAVPQLDDVNIAYIPRNVAPEILSITIAP
ncbi:MAG: PQQ-binding-like beta-propeller repeat protein, partial [Pyrinomonadaceae bacterium]